MKIAIGSDHAGFDLKEYLKGYLEKKGHTLIDVGTYERKSVNYVDYALKVAEMVASGGAEKGILICGTGIGMCIAANKVRGIRAALVHSLYTARMAALHNNANVITMGGRIETPEEAAEFVDTWLTTPFEGGRHEERLNKIKEYEKSIKEKEK